MAVHYRMYGTTMIETKKQNCIDRCTKGVAKYPRLCMMFVHSRIILITFIDCKKKKSKLWHCQYWFSFCIKAIHKTVWCTMHAIFESRNKMNKYKIFTLQVLFNEFLLSLFFKTLMKWYDYFFLAICS